MEQGEIQDEMFPEGANSSSWETEEVIIFY